MSKWACIHIDNGNMYASVNVNRLVYDQSTNTDISVLKNKSVEVIWNKKKNERGEAIVVDIGTRGKMDKMYMRLARQAADQSFDQTDQFNENTASPLKRSRMPSNFYGDDIIPDDSFDSGRPSKQSKLSIKPQTVEALEIISKLKEGSNGFVDTGMSKTPQMGFELVSVDSEIVASAPSTESNFVEVLPNGEQGDPQREDTYAETNPDRILNSSVASLSTESKSENPDKENEELECESELSYTNNFQVNESEKVADLQRKLHLERQKVYKLRKILKKSASLSCKDSTTLGNGISIPTLALDRIRDGWKMRPAFFLRRLMEDTNIFSVEEIAASSVKGKTASTGPKIPRPALDPIRFSTLKNFVIKECQLEKDSGPMVKFEESVSRICSDARKRLKDAKLRTKMTPISQNIVNDTDDDEWC